MPARATVQDGTYPRPMLVRDRWTDLGGTWQLAYDDRRQGRAGAWHRDLDLADRSRFDRDVTVPFPPEAPDSGVGEKGHHPVVWYRRALRLGDLTGSGAEGLATPGTGERLMLRFGAVDFAARVWLDGHLVAEHVGGQTPFSADVTDLVDAQDPDRVHVVTVRAVDEPTDAAQPRGKQDWQEHPHGIWYERTTGIWQPVWAEVVPELGVEALRWTPDVVGAQVRLDVRLSEVPLEPLRLRVRLDVAREGRRAATDQGVEHGEAPEGPPADADVAVDERVELADLTVTVREQRCTVVLPVPALANHQAREALVWRPGHPTLVDAAVTLTDEGGQAVLDEVSSYLGLRSTTVERGAFWLSGHPVDVRSVLAQNWWPSSHLAAPSAAALRREVELARDLGFNAVRVHQKVEDPRFLHWCDRLGVMVWGEIANAFEFSPTATTRLVAEWLEVLERDASHPSIVTWVPLNESWGVGDGVEVAAQRSFSTAMAELTRAVDPTRPVVSNDGWEHTDSDLLTIHDYSDAGTELVARYGSAAAVEAVVAGPGPNGRLLTLAHRGRARMGADDAPVMLTEFGGVRYESDVIGDREDSWGYSTARDADDFAARVGELYDAVRASSVLAGSCWTQLTDTLQEANGLLRADRTPKLPVERLRAIITGEPAT